jgi:hypothetical protein
VPFYPTMKRLATILTVSIILQISSCGPRTNFDTVTFGSASAADTVTIACDSVFNQSGYAVRLILFDSLIGHEYNSIFLFGEQNQYNLGKVFSDTLYSDVGQIEFADYNNDNIKDILVQNISDARSNWTYNLFLTDFKEKTLIKVKGFQKIKNPKLNNDFGIIESHVISGTNYIEFYRLVDQDSIYKYDILVYDSAGEISNKNYRQALEKIRSR